MANPVEGVMKCVLASSGAGGSFKFPTVDEVGPSNLIRQALQSFIEAMKGIFGFIQKYLNPTKIVNLAKDILKLPDIIIKQLVDKFFSKLKLPDFAALVKANILALFPNTTPTPSINIPDFLSMLIGALKALLKGSSPLSFIRSALAPVIATVQGMGDKVKAQVQWVVDYFMKFANLILSFCAIPLYTLKLVIDFVTKKAQELLQGFAGMIAFIKGQLLALIKALLKALGLDVNIPSVPGYPPVPIPPVVQLFSCLLKQVYQILGGLPGNIPGLVMTLA